jgi:hypothetical protein
MRALFIAPLAAAVILLAGCGATDDIDPLLQDQQAKADNVQVSADLANAKMAIVAHMSSTGSTAVPSPAELQQFGFSPSSGTTNFAVFVSATGGFCAQETSGAGVTFKISRSSSAAEGSCVRGTDY